MNALLPPPIPSPPPPAKPSNAWLWVTIMLIVGMCLCGAGAAALAGAGLGSGFIALFREGVGAQQTVDDFMTSMADRDVTRAYALLSTRGQRGTPRTELERQLGSADYVRYEGYLRGSARVTSINLGASTATGTTARVGGTVDYDGGFNAQFTAVMEQEGGKWRLVNLLINVPPGKALKRSL